MNNRTNGMTSGISRVALGCVAALLAACGQASTVETTNTASAPGITATEVKIGSTQPLTGPAAPGYSEIAPASNAYFQYVNAHGGIFGRRITYDFQDDGYNPTRTASVTRQLVLQDTVFAMFSALGTPTHLAVADYLNSEKVPDLFVSSGCNCWNNPSKYPYTFGWQPDYTIEGKILGQYIQQNLAGKKVGYFYQNDEFGLDGVKGLDLQIPSASVVSRQNYVPTNTNVGPQLAALQGAGAEVIVSYTIPAFTALALLTAAKLNYHPTWVVSNVGSDVPTLTGLLTKFSQGKVGGQLLTSLVTDAYLPLITDTSNPWISLFKGIHDQYISSFPWDGNVLYGMAQAYTLVQVLKAAGRNPTRAGVVKTLETTKLTGGPGLAPYGYGSGNHLGSLGVQVTTVGADGSLATVGPIYTSTDSGPITQYAGTPATPPANGIPS
ncbi:MAG: ABC transporter substrate-binding protein [Chloroflexi bacterium]|nr:MAG: ABC transporter substrate-binding protein [Chloroflexota bacterium]